MKLLLFLAHSVVLLATSACVVDPAAFDGDGEEDVGSATGEVAGGTVVPVGQLEAVVKFGLFAHCTGTLITDRLVLTAGHCVCQGTNCNTSESVNFVSVRRVDDPTTPADESATRVSVDMLGKVFVHPDMSIGAPLRNDLAVLRLDRPASEVVMVSPIPVSDFLPAVGSSATLVGYGHSNGSLGECDVAFGTKRRATTQIDQRIAGEAGDMVLILDDPAIHICGGDSGGPLIDAAGRVVGVASTGDSASTSTYRAVAAYREWISLQGGSPGGRVGVWDLSGSAPAAAVYADQAPDPLGLLGWIDTGDLRFTGDFRGLGHDQVLYVNTGGVGGRLRIADYADGAAPTDSEYWENYGQSLMFNGWLDYNDVQLVGDFLGLGHDQLLLINRNPSGGRVMIVSFASASPFVHYRELYGESDLLNGWHDNEDGFAVGDFFGDGYDSVLFVNRGPGAGRILIGDFHDSATPINWRYYEAYADGPQLNGWHDSDDLLFAGDYRGLGYDQVLFVNRGPGNGRVLIADFRDHSFPAEWQLFLSGAQAFALNGWLDNEDVARSGNFRGGSRDQLLLINRTPAGLDRVQVADLSGPSIGIPFYQSQVMTSGLLVRVLDSNDRVLAGDLRGSGTAQLLTLEVLEQ